jgi:hypothetical protein
MGTGMVVNMQFAIISPGCGGFFMVMACYSLMIIN